MPDSDEPGACPRGAKQMCRSKAMQETALQPFREPSDWGVVHRALRRLGPTWLASPVRRLAQATFLVLFLALFLGFLWNDTSSLAGGWAPEAACRPAESLLMADPLVGVSTSLAARAWTACLPWAAALVAVCLFMPRGFCGYACPLGTIIDLFDWAVGRRIATPELRARGWWSHLRYALVSAVLVSSACGVLIAGYVAAIPVLARGLILTVGPAQTGLFRGWHAVPPIGGAHVTSMALLGLILGLSVVQPRFWCRHVCPTGAFFSLTACLRVTDRHVNSTCIGCGKCVDVCPFDAVKEDFSTRATACSFCQTCAGVCPVHAIGFGRRRLSRPGGGGAEPVTDAPGLSRRAFIAGSAGGVVSGFLISRSAAAGTAPALIRPPGAIPEQAFLRTCVRCGLCVSACPTGVLQPTGHRAGVDALWTPRAVPVWSGCSSSCNRCGQVCPTGAIRALPLPEKRAARMGLAVVDEASCLAHTGEQACRLCVDQCADTGYAAVELIRIGVLRDGGGIPVEESGRLAPTVRADKCVGCGLCQTRCHAINVVERQLLASSAVSVVAGPGKEDRKATGSYLRSRSPGGADGGRPSGADEAGTEVEDDYLPAFLDDL